MNSIRCLRLHVCIHLHFIRFLAAGSWWLRDYSLGHVFISIYFLGFRAESCEKSKSSLCVVVVVGSEKRQHVVSRGFAALPAIQWGDGGWLTLKRLRTPMMMELSTSIYLTSNRRGRRRSWVYWTMQHRHIDWTVLYYRDRERMSVERVTMNLAENSEE